MRRSSAEQQQHWLHGSGRRVRRSSLRHAAAARALAYRTGAVATSRFTCRSDAPTPGPRVQSSRISHHLRRQHQCLARKLAVPALRRGAAATSRFTCRSDAPAPGPRVQSSRISHHLRRQHQCLAPKLAVLVLPKWSCRQFVDAAGRARSRCRHLRNRKRGRTSLQSQVHLDPVLGDASCNEDVNSAVVVDAMVQLNRRSDRQH
jgi:hypothetical protein